ncbi:tyrosine-type recombinase/integrase [Devosia submarina]|uniref:tyrosine-type recombinase/integrase n=1 Tax=Devosia submarina TaxID=1173082 RepID=UPI000D3B57E4|nr:site-specific integrase [Devosia submarina]
MARQLNKLSAVGVAALTKPGRHSDGGGLYLSISANGGKRWVFLFRWNGKPTEMGLGSAQIVPLKQAREFAQSARTLLAAGQNPLEAKKAAAPKLQTFGECAKDYVDLNKSQWRNAKHIAQWTSTLETYCSKIWNTPVADVSTEHVLAVLRPIWTTKPETASRLRGRIERVLSSAKVRGLRSGENPALWRGHLSDVLPARKKLSRGHHKALPYAELPTFMVQLRERPAVAARALEFAILTAARSGEVLNAEWKEMDLKTAVWTIPPQRMKAGKQHRVPLSPRAVDLLETMKDEEPGTYVFPGQKEGKPLSAMSLAMMLRRMEVDVTVHGFRSSFRDWAAEQTSYPNEVAEMALAHTIKNAAEAAYRRGDLLEKRRELMNDWARFCELPGSETFGAKYAEAT